jgi:SAM-dependent MidA family methyltransferase
MLNSELLKQVIIKNIDQSAQGRITFADYLDLVLYHEQYGYYSNSKVKIGSEGDYFTASSLGADFGELLGKQLRETWEILGKVQPYTWVEMGAGSGIFARDLLDYVSSNYPQIIEKFNYIIIEQSSALVQQQKQLLHSHLASGINISWKTWEDLPQLSIVGCFFSNELVDAFPVHKIIFKEGELQEIYVSYQDHQFQEIIGDLSTDAIKDYFKLVDINFFNDVYPEGYQTEVNLAALSWLTKVARRLKKGYVITIDYGYSASKYYHPQRYQGTLKCYYQQRHHDNPYVNLGLQDITTHVNFTALEKQGELWQLEKLGFTQQGLFLMALGLGERLTDLSSGKFKLMEMMQRRDALHQLIDPNGLGKFGVLIQCKGLTSEEKNHSLKGLKET